MNKNVDKLIIAHRGESYLAPENTLAAINLAWKNGIAAVEIDVRLTRDKEIVVIHDKNTKRTGNYNKTIEKSILKELREIDVGIFKDTKWKGELIPLLSEVFQTVSHNGKLIIEIKSCPEIIPYLVNEIKRSKLNNSQIEIISFNLKVLSEIKKKIPEYKMLWILNLDYYLPVLLLQRNTKKIVNKIINNNLDGVDVWAGKALNENFMIRLKKHNLLVYTWTVDDVVAATKLIQLGVDAVTTNRAEWLKAQIMNIAYEESNYWHPRVGK